MTITTPARSLADPNTHGLFLSRSILMGLVRFAVLTGAGLLYGLTISGKADPVGAGLVGLMLTVALAGLWAMVDGWRRPLRTAALAWALASVLLVVLGPLPETLSYPAAEGGWTGLGDYLSTVADGAGFMFALNAVPAAAGLAIGHLIRVSFRRPASRPAPTE